MSSTNQTPSNQDVINEFRSNGGKVGGAFDSMPMLLLTSIGAKSGKARTHPLAYTMDGERFVIIASKGGAPTNPDWYYNLKANPHAKVEVGTESFPAIAEEATVEERQRLFDQTVAKMPFFAEYQKQVKRQIPVLTLTREES